ncbi:unnamed protein product [Miscanthus lutarioriparius]|uniref:Uncharacterized protein n=1 Tax=Miscanthus lutarioriparius TaxID=422564 RepID=A0A811PP51_9POAL|nr:unnamed protein product [Miscanthus lutarioriparius]
MEKPRQVVRKLPAWLKHEGVCTVICRNIGRLDRIINLLVQDQSVRATTTPYGESTSASGLLYEARNSSLRSQASDVGAAGQAWFLILKVSNMNIASIVCGSGSGFLTVFLPPLGDQLQDQSKWVVSRTLHSGSIVLPCSFIGNLNDCRMRR